MTSEMARAGASGSLQATGRRWIFGTFLASLTVVLGFALLALAIPRTVAAWATLVAQPALEKLQLDKSPSDAELEIGVAGLQRALAWTPSARRLTDLALLELTQAQRLDRLDPRRAELLAVAEQHLTAGLAANPANGFAWFRLAVIRELRGSGAREIAAALAQSQDMSPNMRRLWISRLEWSLRYLQAFTGDELLAMRSQIRSMWSVPEVRSEMLAAARRSGRIMVIGWALSEDPPAYNEFERLRRL